MKIMELGEGNESQMSDEGDLEGRLQGLLAKRGQELVRGLIEEVMFLHREIGSLRRELSALSEYQAMRDRWLSIGDDAPTVMRFPRLVVIEPQEPLRASDGFYPAEQAGDGTPFRWTGPSAQFSFNVFVDRARGADLKLETINCIDTAVQKHVSLLVNGEPVPVDVVENGTGFIATASLPAHDDGRVTNLVFVLPAALSPGPEDSRLMGTAFRRLTVAARNEANIAPELAVREEAGA
jgi:hypothetical protein